VGGPWAWETLVSVSGTPVPRAVDVQAVFAATMVDEWVRGGVVHAVVCPGSRSTPLALALATHPGMTVHVRLDERSAGFTALGMALSTGVPALVVTTSGTAAAELHPAMVEADLAGVPVIACTADRPPELRDVGAPQTIDQDRLFGRSVRWFCDPGVPDRLTQASWRSLAARALAEAEAGRGGPGPVHLNLPFREPLLGDVPGAGGVAPGRPDGGRWHRVGTGPVPPPAGAVDTLIEAGRAGDRRGVIVAGAGCGDPTAVLALSAALDWPVLAEPRSGLRDGGGGVVAAADGILRSEWFSDRHVPEVVLRLGAPWVSKVVTSYLSAAARGGAPAIVVDPWGRWQEPERNATDFVRCDPTLFCLAAVRAATAASRAPGDSVTHSGWGEAWRRAESAARAVISAALGADHTDHADHGVPGAVSLTEPSVAHRLFAAAPAASTLVVSSSMPVRDLEAFAVPRPGAPRVVANRGANGIDGVVSTALGVALASPHPTVALVGDLAFLHDVSALVRPPGLDPSLTVVVADNHGGGIFSFLEAASVLDEAPFEVLFGTPQAPDVAEVAAGFGWPVDDLGPDDHASVLEEALDRRVAAGAMSVIRVRVPARGDNVGVHQRIHAAIVEAVDAGERSAQQGTGS
jgi:2-succinyl-5-enolpyruvyl-6-hydroxy-3-cyclohexene-1-carboxylate synthase